MDGVMEAPAVARPIPFAWHSIGEDEVTAVRTVVSSGGPLTNGQFVAAFELAFAKFVGAKFAIATSSCTTALEACCLALELGPEHEAITTPFTFTATANAPRRTGARVRFVDVKPGAYHMDPAAVLASASAKTRAILPVHYAGLALDMDGLAQIARATGATLIEDAAQAAGSQYPDGNMVGSREDTLCCFSFGPEKVMTTGYGGMVTTGNADLAAALRLIVRQGLERQGPFRDQRHAGMNAAIGELQAAIGLVQLRKLEGFIERRRRLAGLYRNELVDVPGVDLPPWNDYETNGALFPVGLLKRQKAIEALAAAGIATSIHYKPVHLHSAWSGVTPGRGSFPHAEVAGAWLLSLPLYPTMAEADVLRVAQIVRDVHVG